MIWSAVRASAWKYAAIFITILFIAALIAALFFRASSIGSRAANAALTARAEAAESRIRTLEDAAKRDAQSDAATNKAQAAMDSAAAVTNDRLTRLERRLDGRPPVPAVCPGPDPVISAELQDGRARFRSTEGRLRSLRTAEGSGT